MITILFRDKSNNIYSAKKADGKIVGFNLLLLAHGAKLSVNELFEDLQLHEFLIVSIEEKNNLFRIEPIVTGSLIASDSEEELAVPLCEMDHDKLLETMNGLLPEKYLQG